MMITENLKNSIRVKASRPLVVKGLAAGAKGLFNLGRKGVAEGIKSDFARNKIKSIGRQYLDQLVDSTTNSLSEKIAGKASGAGVDIHKAIGKLPKPKSGWTLPGHKYTGPYLTNKEASTALCSVVKHAGSGRTRKKCRGKHETQSSVFPHFLSALPLPLFVL